MDNNGPTNKIEANKSPEQLYKLNMKAKDFKPVKMRDNAVLKDNIRHNESITTKLPNSPYTGI